KLVNNGEFIVSVQLSRLSRIPCLDRNGNISNSRSTASDHLAESKKESGATPSKRESHIDTPPKRSSKASKKEAKESKKEEEPKSLMVNIPLSSTKKGALSSGSSSSATTTPGKKSSKDLVDQLDSHYGGRNEYHSRN